MEQKVSRNSPIHKRLCLQSSLGIHCQCRGCGRSYESVAVPIGFINYPRCDTRAAMNAISTKMDTNSKRDTRLGPLDGILVVSIEQAVAAPLCTARLVDAGARVIKIERSTGDFARGYDAAALGDSSYFVWTNHGKQSIELDFKDADDALLLHRIIAKADVFIQNLAPGAAQRAGFGSEELREMYPRLITCDISGYGDSAELKGMKAYDLLVQAESGLVSISGTPGEYGRIGVSLCDIGAGVTAHAGILESLLSRANTGKGSAIAVSLFDVAAANRIGYTCVFRAMKC